MTGQVHRQWTRMPARMLRTSLAFTRANPVLEPRPIVGAAEEERAAEEVEEVVEEAAHGT